MTRTQRMSPIPRFIEADADAGPMELLGLTPGECTPSRIEAALQRQLDRVSSHAEGDTPEADEVRLALHTAAAQLLDPEVRRQMIERHVAGAASEAAGDREAMGEGRGGERVSEPMAAPEVVREVQPFTRPSVGVRVTAGDDPNAPVRKFLIVGGVFVALAVTVVVAGIIFLTPSGPTKTIALGTTPSGAPPLNATANGAAGLSLDGSVVSGPPTSAGAPPIVPNVRATPDAAVSNRTEFIDGALVVRELRAASVKAKTDASEGVVAFRKAIAPLADWWPRFEVGQRRAADDAVLEFLYVVSDKPDAASAAIAELAKRAVLPPDGAAGSGPLSADAIWPAAWATGMLTRLSVERELPRSLAAGVAGAINEALGAGRAAGTLTFEGGVEAALRRMPLRLVAPGKPDGADANAPRTSAEAVKRWADAVGAASFDGVERERMLADALEEILISGPEPDSDPAAYEAVEVLVTRIKWRADSPARERLLEWFNDSRVSSGDLRVLTSVLASKSNAEGVDATMLLSVTATPDDRAQLRAKYAQVWGIAKTEAREKAFEDWRAYARGGFVLNAADDDLGRVARLVVAVQINHAARRLWLGDSAGCARIVSNLERIPNTIRDIGTPIGPAPLTIPLPGPSGPPMAPMPGRGRGPGNRGPGGGKLAAPGVQSSPYGGEGPWAEVYLRAERNIPVRLQRLLEAESLPVPLTRLDASVLVEQACFASPAQVRAAAQRVVMKYSDDPSIVQSCLDELPLAPKVQSVSEMLAKVSRTALPKIGDPEWEITARRGLVDRLLGLLAGQGPQAGIDQAAALIAESYLNMAGAESGPADESAADRCLRGASQLFKLWRLDADRLPPPEKAPLTLDQIDRRSRSRRQIASGPVQAFAGEEVSVAEMLSYIVCAERPVQAARAQVIIDDMAVERRGATHIFEQMTATERAITRLWMLRFGEVGQ